MGKGRAPCCDKNQVKRGPWSPAEDLRLITFIQKHGHDNWRALPKQAGLMRCGKSCRLRWINYLRPDVKRGNFTQDEEETVIKLHKTWGNKWSKIASRLPGRTDNEIKNVWNTHLKKRVKSDNISDNSSESPTTSSSSSFSTIENQNSETEQTVFPPDKNETPHGSFESTNSSISSSQLWQQDPLMDSQFEFESLENMGIEIPFECDIDFWNMFETIDLLQPNEAAGIRNSAAGIRNSAAGELENYEWLKYLENELGLNQPPENNAGENISPENSEEKLADSSAFHWSKANPEVDAFMTYFQVGP